MNRIAYTKSSVVMLCVSDYKLSSFIVKYFLIFTSLLCKRVERYIILLFAFIFSLELSKAIYNISNALATHEVQELSHKFLLKFSNESLKTNKTTNDLNITTTITSTRANNFAESFSTNPPPFRRFHKFDGRLCCRCFVYVVFQRLWHSRSWLDTNK